VILLALAAESETTAASTHKPAGKRGRIQRRM
jgi:hypothetical protein